MPRLIFTIEGAEVGLDIHDGVPEYQIPQMMMLLPTPCVVESVRAADESGEFLARVAASRLDCRVEPRDAPPGAVFEGAS